MDGNWMSQANGLSGWRKKKKAQNRKTLELGTRLFEPPTHFFSVFPTVLAHVVTLALHSTHQLISTPAVLEAQH